MFLSLNYLPVLFLSKIYLRTNNKTEMIVFRKLPFIETIIYFQNILVTNSSENALERAYPRTEVSLL